MPIDTFEYRTAERLAQIETTCECEGLCIHWRNEAEFILREAVRSSDSSHAAKTPAVPGSESEATSGWMPIETAPKDGTQILGWTPYWADHVQNVWWYTGLGRWSTTMQPTHWMPLPDPPKIQATESGASTALPEVSTEGVMQPKSVMQPVGYPITEWEVE